MRAAIGEKMFGHFSSQDKNQRDQNAGAGTENAQKEPIGKWWKEEKLVYEGNEYHRRANFLSIHIPQNASKKDEKKLLEAVVLVGSHPQLSGLLRKEVDKELLGEGYTAEDSMIPFVYPYAELIPVNHGMRMVFIKVSSPMISSADLKEWGWEFRVTKATDKIIGMLVKGLSKKLPIQWCTTSDNAEVLEALNKIAEIQETGITIDILNTVRKDNSSQEEEPGPLEEKLFGSAPKQGDTVGGGVGGPI